jgi:hypothetical protein
VTVWACASFESAPPGAGAGDAAAEQRGCAKYRDAVFCADFDEGRIMDFFEAPLIDDGGTLVLDDAVSSSAPRSLHATAIGATECVSANAPKKLELPARVIHVEYDLRLDSDDTVLGGAQLTLRASDGSGRCAYWLVTQPTNVSLRISSRTTSAVETTPVPLAAPRRGRFVRVGLDLDETTISVRFDGTIFLNRHPIPAPCTLGIFESISIGANCVAAGRTADLHVDDVVVRVE